MYSGRSDLDCSAPSVSGMRIRPAAMPVVLLLSLFNLSSGQTVAPKPEVLVQTGHTSALSRLVFSPDGRMLASVGLTENSIKLWEVDSGRQLRSFELPHRNQVSDIV